MDTEISATFTTADEATAIAIGAVYLAEQNVYIDDIKVEQLIPATIKFETDGGDPIDNLTGIIPYSDISSNDPGFAYKIGYEFLGWYLDAAFTKPFDFLTDTITGDVVLYAKYIKEEEEPDEEDESDDFDYDDYDDNDYDDEDELLFGDPLQVLSVIPREKPNSMVRLIKTPDSGSTLPAWLIIVIAAGGAVLLGGGALAFILIRRSRKRKM